MELKKVTNGVVEMVQLLDTYEEYKKELSMVLM